MLKLSLTIWRYAGQWRHSVRTDMTCESGVTANAVRAVGFRRPKFVIFMAKMNR
jgi:hypothetical protein